MTKSSACRLLFIGIVLLLASTGAHAQGAGAYCDSWLDFTPHVWVGCSAWSAPYDPYTGQPQVSFMAWSNLNGVYNQTYDQFWQTLLANPGTEYPWSWGAEVCVGIPGWFNDCQWGTFLTEVVAAALTSVALVSDLGGGNCSVTPNCSGGIVPACPVYSLTDQSGSCSSGYSILSLAEAPDPSAPQTCTAQSVERTGTTLPGDCRLSAPSVSLQLKATGSELAAPDDAAAPNYVALRGSSQLGFFVGGPAPGGCLLGTEMVGNVMPSTYSGALTLRRRVLSEACYQNATPIECVGEHPGPPPYDDTSDPVSRDDNPQSGGSAGKIYDLDNPGIIPSSSNVQRWRVNFEAYATMPDGTVVGGPLFYYLRASCSRDLTGVHFVLDLPRDNQVGIGSTPLTWNAE